MLVVEGTKDTRFDFNCDSVAVMAEDTAIVVVADAISAASARVTPTFRAPMFAVCASRLVVTPDPTVTVQRVPSTISADAATMVSVAAAAPELVVVAVNVVVPHPLIAGVSKDPQVKVGRTKLMLSATFKATFN